MKKLLVALLIFTLVTSCTAPQQAINYVTKTDTITITIRERVKDSVIYTPTDQATFEALIFCDSLNRAYLTAINTKPGKRTQIIYIQKNDTIKLTANVDSAAIYIKWRERDTTSHTKASTQTTTIYLPPEPKKNKPIPNWLVFGGLILLLILIGAIKSLFK
jgi:hypothetical protein